MSVTKHTPHYKTLDIIVFYDHLYDFINKYLIFFLASFFSVIILLVIWLCEPSKQQIISTEHQEIYTDSGFIQESWLVYPVNYYAQKTIELSKDNKIYGLGGPIWRSQSGIIDNTWNSLNNIIQFNGVILPRQLSNSSWVPKLQQDHYTKSMIKTFLDGMATSEANIDSIKRALTKSKKDSLSGSLLETFGISCTQKNLFITKFCDLKIIDSIGTRGKYDLSTHISELQGIYDYIFTTSNNKELIDLYCNVILQQYRYNGSSGLIPLSKGCNTIITKEINTISDMVAVSNEIAANKFTSTSYKNPLINQYKLMSWYQYLMKKIINKDYTDGVDEIMLTNYNTYITIVVNNNEIIQPYGDIITIFHQEYLIPWLDSRQDFASTAQKELTKELKKTTSLIINGSEKLGTIPITSGSKLQSESEYEIQQQGSTGSSLSASASVEERAEPVEQKITNPISNKIDTPPNTNPTTIQSTNQSTPPSINQLIATVLGTEPISVNKLGSSIKIKYHYQGSSWFALIDMSRQGSTQLYYDSPSGGATKITHAPFIFSIAAQKTITTIMDSYQK